VGRHRHCPRPDTWSCTPVTSGSGFGRSAYLRSTRKCRGNERVPSREARSGLNPTIAGNSVRQSPDQSLFMVAMRSRNAPAPEPSRREPQGGHRAEWLMPLGLATTGTRLAAQIKKQRIPAHDDAGWCRACETRTVRPWQMQR
jgi:hypothetical protein